MSNFSIKFTNCDETKCKEVNQMFLSQANYYRAFHSADPLILDDGVSKLVVLM